MISIRRMEEKDLPQVAAIERATFSLPWSEEGFRTSLNSADTLYLAAVDEQEQVVGYCGILRSFDEGEITNVAIAENYRKNGIGYQMLSELLSQGRKIGITRFLLEVRAGNTPAIHLYQKLGFTALGIRKKFYERPIEDAVIMQYV